MDSTLTTPVPAVAKAPTPDESQEISAWNLRAARAYAEIALRRTETHLVPRFVCKLGTALDPGSMNEAVDALEPGFLLGTVRHGRIRI